MRFMLVFAKDQVVIEADKDAAVYTIRKEKYERWGLEMSLGKTENLARIKSYIPLLPT